MKKLTQHIILSGLVALALAGGPTANAANSTNDANSAKAPAVKRDTYPFHGTVSSVDNQAKTVSLKKTQGERVLKIDSKSLLEVEGKPGLLGDVKVGNYAHGTLHKDASGAEIIVSAKFDKEAPARKKKSSDDSSAAKPSASPN